MKEQKSCCIDVLTEETYGKERLEQQQCKVIRYIYSCIVLKYNYGCVYEGMEARVYIFKWNIFISKCLVGVSGHDSDVFCSKCLQKIKKMDIKIKICVSKLSLSHVAECCFLLIISGPLRWISWPFWRTRPLIWRPVSAWNNNLVDSYVKEMCHAEKPTEQTKTSLGNANVH